MVAIDAVKLPKTLGRHTRLTVTFDFQLAGSLVDLEADGYTAVAYVEAADGTLIVSGAAMTVAGTVASYHLAATDLSAASATSQAVAKVWCVVSNGTNRLVSDKRTIAVGDWNGADSFTP